MNQEYLSSLVKSPDLEKLYLMLQKPNFFEILNSTTYEIRHSNFLAWIINPQGSHRLGDSFTKWFFKEIFSDAKVEYLDEFQVDGLDTSKIQVYREFHNIDLLIELPEIVVVIENKIKAKESNSQLKRYREITNNIFPNKKLVFVYLTPDAIEPEREDDRKYYIAIDYESIVRLLDIVIDIHHDSISDKVRFYIQDYISNIRRNILLEDEVVEFARNIYKDHRNALDFIFEHKPDRLLEASEKINSAIISEGYELCSLSKGYSRFLTKKLKERLPTSILSGWKNNESFLFELSFKGKTINLLCSVSPGDQVIRQKIISALQKIDGARNPKSLKWSVVHSHSHKIDINYEKYIDDKTLEKDVQTLLQSERDFIEKIEVVLLNEFS